MQLLISPTSPFARKARILILEKGITCETVVANPWEDDPRVLAANPLRKIPVLLADDGAAIFDSRVICEHLDSLGGGPRLLPADPAARAAEKTREALADGAAESLAAPLMAKRVDPEISGPAWEKWMLDKVRGAFARFAEEMKKSPRDAGAPPLLGDIAVFCALDFALFRRPDLNWRDEHAGLAEWFDRVNARESARKTDPRG